MLSKFAKNSLFYSSSSIIRILASILTIPILTRTMGLEAYGMWVFIFTLVQTFSLLFDFGLSTSVTVFLSSEISKGDFKKVSSIAFAVIKLSLFISFLISLPCFLFPDLFLRLLLVDSINQHESQLYFLLRWGALGVSLKLLQQILVGIEQAFQNYKEAGILSTFECATFSFFQILIAYSHGTASDFLVCYALINLLTTCAHVYTVRKFLVKTTAVEKIHLEEVLGILKYSFFVWITVIGGVAFARGDRIIVGAFLNNVTLAIYSTFVDVSSAIYSLSSALAYPVISYFNKIEEDTTNNQINLFDQVRFAFQASSLVAFSMFTVLSIYSDLIITLLLGQEYSNASNIFILRVSLMIYTLSCLKSVGFYITLKNDGKKAAAIQLVSSVLALALIFILSRSYGLVGGVVGNVGFLTSLLFTFTAKKYFPSFSNIFLKSLYLLAPYFLIVVIVSFSPLTLFQKVAFSCSGEIVLLYWFFSGNKGVFSNMIGDN
jgi:O-antigen/teichoic acid export membrane protein